MYKEFEISNRGKLTPGIIEALEIGLTSRCNYNCPYCGAYKAEETEIGKNIGIDVLLKKIESITSLKEVSLSGGEVLLEYEDCLKVCDFCREKGLILQINTNGSTLTVNRLKELAAHGLSTIHFSLNFANAKDYSTYYKVTENAFHHLLKMIEAAQMIENCVVESIICDEFFDNLCDISKILGNYPKVIYQLQYGMNRTKWGNGITNSLTVELLEKLFANKPTAQTMIVSCISMKTGGNAHRKLKRYMDGNNIYFVECNDGRQRFHVDRKGDLIACDIGFPYKFGNIFDEKFDIHSLKYDTKSIRDFIDNHVCEKACVLE